MIESAKESERIYAWTCRIIWDGAICTVQVNDFNAITLSKEKIPEKKKNKKKNEWGIKPTTSNCVVMEWSHTKLNGLSKFNGSNNNNENDDD